MSDITVVALTLGEPYAERALASVERQTLAPAATVVVREVSPFHRALNAGASQVRTPFFLQLDADVILDDNCLADLRALMRDDVSMTSGLLRDPIVGRTTGVRLYRTACFDHAQIRDSISPDMDFTDDTARLGWVRRCALRWPADRARWHTFGDHRPDYTPLYTFNKFRLEGVRARYRRREGRARLMFERLCPSVHPASTLALIATAHGFFDRQQGDLLAPYRRTAEFDGLQDFLAAGNGGPALDPPADAAHPQQRFRAAYVFAAACRQRRAPGPFLAELDRLRNARDADAWVALAGLCQGVFELEYSDDRASEAYAALAEIL